MNVLFLNVDGVLNKSTYYERKVDDEGTLLKEIPGTHDRNIITPSGFTGVEDELINNLVKIKENVIDLKIILSSDWKTTLNDDMTPNYEDMYGRDGEYLINKLKSHGIVLDGKTVGSSSGNISSSRRGTEIRDYLSKHPEVTKFVIVDDVEFIDYTNELEDAFVMTDYRKGLDAKTAEKIIEKFMD